MSVLKNKRSISNLEFYHTARELRKNLTEWIRQNLGVYTRRNLRSLQGKPDGYYNEDLAESGKALRTLLRRLLFNITAANSIYITTDNELADRRHYQTEAIINCQQIVQELIFIEDSLPIKMSCAAAYADDIRKEIGLLKNWRKSNNKAMETIKGKTYEQ